jgi:hypothetical protein
MFDERDFKFLDPDIGIGLELRAKLIDMDMDDDVMTDEETLQGAKMMLHHELERAVSDYLDH